MYVYDVINKCMNLFYYKAVTNYETYKHDYSKIVFLMGALA